ncbi:hypothetical protein BDW22DRAFT_805766 [Trametopsis cervina]|nr:hypothetical protein BDW22DRAFT_805766 [Trametopsis cervina]
MTEHPDHPTSPPSTATAAQLLLLPASPPNDPPPPYPSRERRRAPRPGRRRRTLPGEVEHLLIPFSSSDPEGEAAHSPHPDFDSPEFEQHDEQHVSETVPLLSPSRLPPGVGGGAGGIERRTRTLSISSTLHSVTSIAPSFARTVLSAFRPDRDCDLDPDVDPDLDADGDGEGEVLFSADEDLLESPVLRTRRYQGEEQTREFGGNGRYEQRRQVSVSMAVRWRRYFRPVTRRAYYSALFHLLVINFPYALLAWVYLFVFTLTGTTTLMALPLGALLCFLDLLGARVFARGELELQTTFHGPLAFPAPSPPHPIFTRTHVPTPSEIEDGAAPRPERSFYRNAYAMFTDATSYQALFYFIVIKPGITVFLWLLVLVFVPVAFVLVLPAPAILRLVRRLGIWQANIAVEGLCYTVR